MIRKVCWFCKFWLDGWPNPELEAESSTRKVCEYSFTAFNFTCEHWQSKSAEKLKQLQEMAVEFTEAYGDSETIAKAKEFFGISK